jgi:hypothetical protein
MKYTQYTTNNNAECTLHIVYGVVIFAPLELEIFGSEFLNKSDLYGLVTKELD